MAGAEYTELDTSVVGGIKTSVLRFDLPLNHNSADVSETVGVVVKIVNTHRHGSTSPADVFSLNKDVQHNADNLIVYLQGGPGFASAFPTSVSDPPFLKPLLDRGYTVVLLDQRGTGLSEPIDTELLLSKGSTQQQFDYVKHFRADSIVHDCEHIRTALLGADGRWSLLGQSFGGFASITYASFYPRSLRHVFLTGGLPPLTVASVDDVYHATFERTKERNLAYYARFPQDVDKVRRIVEHLAENTVVLPNGGVLSVDRFRGLGLKFGGSGGTYALHVLVTTMHAELEYGRLSYATRLQVMNSLGFETNVLYFLFQEAIYLNGSGRKSDWAADRVLASRRDGDSSADDPFMFTGEIVTRSMLQSHSQLRPLAPLAEYIHSYDQWSQLYDLDTLRTLRWDTLPIVASVYLDDQYVDYELGRRNRAIFEYKPVVTNRLFHNGLAAASEHVLAELHSVLDNGDYM